MIISSLKKFFNRTQKLQIYTDGSHKGRWGAWAFVVVKNNEIIYEASGRERKTDSHRMEFRAAIEALKYLTPKSVAVIHTDSKVLMDSFSKPRARIAVNQDQIDLAEELICNRQITWKWVKAHHGNIYNERCDHLCIVARNGNMY